MCKNIKQRLIVCDNECPGKILSVLGQGGMGTVYKARHVHMDKLYAIKTRVQGAVDDEKSFLRFEQEARAAASLNHRNIIAVTDFGRSKQGFAFLVMEFLNGKTLDDLLMESDVFMGLERFQQIFSQVCDGMQHAHKKGIIHRDLKPSNLMLIDNEDVSDLVKILDFGLAKLSGGDAQHLTQSGIVLGSPPFMSPEQCRGGELDFRSDIYSLGCVMYTVLTGEVPLRGANSMATMYKHISDTPVPVSQASAEIKIPAVLESIIMQTLEKDPSRRPQSMSELGNSINEAVSGWAACPAAEQKAAAAALNSPLLQPAEPPAGSYKPGANFPDEMTEIMSQQIPGVSAAAASLPGGALAAKKPVAIVLPRHTKKVRARKIQTLSRTGVLVIALLALGLVVSGIWSTVNHQPGKDIVSRNNQTISSPTGAQTALPETTSPPAAPANLSSATVKVASGRSVEPSTVQVDSLSHRSALPAKKAGVSVEKKAADAAKKLEALKQAEDLSIQAGSAFAAQHFEEARNLYIRCLSAEKLAYGKYDSHLFFTTVRILESAKRAYLPEDESYVEEALEIYSKAEQQCRQIIDGGEAPPASWRSLGFACLEMSKKAEGTARQRYANWAFDFYSYAYKSWAKRPRRQDYLKMLHSYLVAAETSGETERGLELKQEIAQVEQDLSRSRAALPYGNYSGRFGNFIPGNNGNQNGNNNLPQGQYAGRRRFFQQ